jgi:hypothetical protein
MTKLILVDPVEDEELKRFVHGLILQTSYNARSKEKKGYHSSDRSIITFILLYIGLAIELSFKHLITNLLVLDF